LLIFWKLSILYRLRGLLRFCRLLCNYGAWRRSIWWNERSTLVTFNAIFKVNGIHKLIGLHVVQLHVFTHVRSLSLSCELTSGLCRHCLCARIIVHVFVHNLSWQVAIVTRQVILSHLLPLKILTQLIEKFWFHFILLSIMDIDTIASFSLMHWIFTLSDFFSYWNLVRQVVLAASNLDISNGLSCDAWPTISHVWIVLREVSTSTHNGIACSCEHLGLWDIESWHSSFFILSITD